MGSAVNQATLVGQCGENDRRRLLASLGVLEHNPTNSLTAAR